MAGLAGDHEHEADSDPPPDQVADPARGARSIPRDENPPMHLPANRLGGRLLEARPMSRMSTVVASPCSAGSFVARNKTLALASDPKPSRPMPLSGGGECGSAVEAK
jgi:hypothetical protein